MMRFTKPSSQEEALKNAPKKDSDYFKVPKFLDK
jgi:Asp-tRNA(Asn)/Glu-tRNA(Gln) amidotransferase C subunit